MPLGVPHSRFRSWPEEDQDKALAFLGERSKVCQGCLTRQEEWEADRFAYVADTSRCPGCELLEQERQNLHQEHEDIKGLRIFLRRPTQDERRGLT